MKEPGKIYIASVRAIFFDPRLSIQEVDLGSLIIRSQNAVEPVDEYVVHVEQMPMLFLWMTEAEAREEALRKAETWLPKESGFSHHTVTLKEIPRSMFIQAQVFMSIRELWDRLLRSCGFAD